MTADFKIAIIVEGHGDRFAAPLVVRRIAATIDQSRSVVIHPPFRVPRGSVVKVDELERYVELAARQVSPDGAVLVLLDADEDCAATLGPALLARALAQRSTMVIGVALAVTEFEAWFLASAGSLAGKRGLRHDLEPPANPEGVKGAKGWLQSRRTDGRAYSETIDQPALASMFDMTVARANAPSFDKFWREVERLMIATAG